MSKELQLDDVDLDRLKSFGVAIRHAAAHNPVIAVETQIVEGKVVKKHIRMKSLSKRLQRKLKTFFRG